MCYTLSVSHDVQIHVWRIPLRLRDGDQALLTDAERARAQRLIIEEKRIQFISGRAALRRLLGQAVDRDPARIEFEYGEHGKPELRDAPDLSFNLSHSHGQGLLAIARATPGYGPPRLGADIEYQKPGRSFSDIAERFFSAQEYASLGGAGDDQIPELFYRAWTLKEAYLKAWGTGLTFPSNRFTITMEPNEDPRVVETQMPDDDPARWRMHRLDRGDYAAAVCFDGPAAEIIVRHLDDAES